MIEWRGFQEKIETFTFRNEGAIKVPKSVREKAYTLQIDCEITQTLSDGYKNFKSAPPYGFYGYAVVVLRDFTQVQIALEQPRQTLYYDRLENAYSNWYNLYLQAAANENFFLQQEGILLPIGIQLGLEPVPIEQECLSFSGFNELPVRELYIKTMFGTTFKVEISWWEPVAAVYGDCSYDGASGQIDDPKKDSGLPSGGVQPQVAPNSASPYLGADEPSGQQELGEFFNDKLDNLGDPNPENAPDGQLYWIEFRKPRQAGSFTPSCSIRYSKVIIPIPRFENPYILRYQEAGIDCANNSYGTFFFDNPDDGSLLGTAGFLDSFGGSVSYGTGFEYPATIYYSQEPV